MSDTALEDPRRTPSAKIHHLTHLVSAITNLLSACMSLNSLLKQCVGYINTSTTLATRAEDYHASLNLSQKSLATIADYVQGPDVHNGMFRGDSKERRNIVRDIDKKLRAYNELVLQHSELRKRPPVSSKDRNNLVNWFETHGRAIASDETKYIHHSEDLFSIVPKSKTPLRCFMERSQRFRLFRWWLKASPIEDEDVHYTSDQRIDTFVNMIIALIGLIMLIVPLWVLAFVTSVVNRLAIITSFVVVFLCFVSFTTVARPFETLGAAAA